MILRVVTPASNRFDAMLYPVCARINPRTGHFGTVRKPRPGSYSRWVIADEKVIAGSKDLGGKD
jgi:hypothetical protein